MTDTNLSGLAPQNSMDGTEYVLMYKSGVGAKLLLTAAIRTWIGYATSAVSGLMRATDVQKLNAIAAGATANQSDAYLLARANHTGQQAAETITGLHPVATSGAYGALSGRPASSDLHQGFSWFPDYAAAKGSTLNDYNSFGTGAYVAMAATGTTYDAASEYHTFSSSAATNSAAGIRSAQPVAKRGNNAHQGGFRFKSVLGWTRTAGSCLAVGMVQDTSKPFSNFSDSDIGIAVGFNGGDANGDRLKIMTGDGTAVQRTDAASGTIGDNSTYYIDITLDPGATEARVTVIDLNSGDKLFDNVAVTLRLPPANTPLYAMAAQGTLTGTAAAVIRLHNISAKRAQAF